MTCIAAVRHAGSICMGGDSAGVGGWELHIRADAKVFRNGPFLIGFTGSFRMGQILRYSFTPPERKVKDIFRYMTTSFVDSVRTALGAGGFRRKQDEQEHGGVFMIGYEGRLFTIYSDFQVSEDVDDFAAVGCGSDAARGALYALLHTTLRTKPTQMIRRALEAAERTCAAVRGPFVIKKMRA